MAGDRRAASSLPIQVTGMSSWLGLFFTDRPIRTRRDAMTADPARQRAFSLGLLAGGVYLAPSHPGFTSAAHTRRTSSTYSRSPSGCSPRSTRRREPGPRRAPRARAGRVRANGRPGRRSLHEQAKGSLLHGVPMHWMAEWASPYPLFLRLLRAPGSTDVDGNLYADFCLGDTGAHGGSLAGADGGGSRAAGRARASR